MCAGPVPHNQKCVMVNMSADPVAMIAGLVQVRTDIHTGRVQLKHAR